MFLNIVNCFIFMYCDFVLASKDLEFEKFAKRLGFSRLVFKDDFSKMGIAEAKDYGTNRKLVETKRVKILVNPHINSNKDSLHFRTGGLDHVLCNLASKNNTAIGFSLDSLNNPVVIGRVKQNIKLCRKYKVRMVFFTFAKNKYELRSVQDLLSLLRVLGMNGKEAKDALSYC